MLNIRQSLRSIFRDKFNKTLLSKDSLKKDLYAGLIVGLIVIPQSLAYAQLAGLPPVYGLYASILPVIIAVLFGSSSLLSTGPVAVLSILTSTTLAPLATPGTDAYVTYAIILALASGVFQVGLGLLRAGWLVNFLSHPVTFGFINGAGIIIIFSQLKTLFGLSIPNEAHYYLTVWNTILAIPYYANWTTVAIGAGSILSILIIKKINPKIPGMLIVLVLGTILCWWFGFDVKTIGIIENPIPKLTIPEFHLAYLYDLFLGIILITIIGFAETIAIAQSVATKTKEKINPDQELVGQGLANISSAFSGSYPVAGSFSRTALNYSNGAKTWMSSVFCALIIIIAITLFYNVLQYTPQVILAIIIITGVSSIINIKKIVNIFKINKYDGLAALITLLGTLVFAPDMEKGIFIGFIFSIGYFIYKNTHPNIVFLSRYKDNALRDTTVYNLKQCQNILVIRLDGPLFFANANFFENRVIAYLSAHPNINHVILVGGAISNIDATGAEILNGLLENLISSGKSVYISNIKYEAEKIFKTVGLWQKIHANNFFNNTQIAVKEVIKIANQNQNHLDEKECPLENFIPKKHKTKDKDSLTAIAEKYLIKPIIGNNKYF
jgi:SulP family sulfate permease